MTGCEPDSHGKLWAPGRKGVFPCTSLSPLGSHTGHPWEMPNEQGTKEAQPPGSPVELGRPWIPQGSGPSKSSHVLPLAGPAVIARMPSFSQNMKAGTAGKEACRSRSMTFLIVSKPSTPAGSEPTPYSSHPPDGSLKQAGLILQPEGGCGDGTLLSRALSYPGILMDQPPSQRTRARNPEPGPSSGVGGGACWLPSDEGGCLSGGGSASFMP